MAFPISLLQEVHAPGDVRGGSRIIERGVLLYGGPLLKAVYRGV